MFGDYEEPVVKDIRDYRLEGALNHDLEVTFCPGGSVKGPIELKKCGAELEGIIKILCRYTTVFPQLVVL